MIGFLLFASLSISSMADDNLQPAPPRALSYALAGQADNASRSDSTARLGPDTDVGPQVTSYRVSGEKSLQPWRINDDGVHMYLEWSDEQALPAVFALNAIGEEEIVDGYMRQGIFTIDRVHVRLVFRIGKKRARAERVNR